MEPEREALIFTTQTEWHAWLQTNHAVESDVWLLIARKGSERKSLSLAQAVEEALCFGWIDSHMRPVDAQSYRLRFSPRRSGSVWAISNIRRVEKLMQQGRMAPAGLAAVESAKDSGEWDAAARREDVSLLPPELEQALQADESARVAYHQLAPSLKKQYHHWITSAKRAETRHKRVQQLLEKLLRD
jgi:uncharacterized protein YdeI (YjbR/CyaY-like superfamily)